MEKKLGLVYSIYNSCFNLTHILKEGMSIDSWVDGYKMMKKHDKQEGLQSQMHL